MRRLTVLAAGALIFVVLAFGLIQKERVLRDGTTVLVPLGPRDPRSLMQGDYMVLRYDVPQRIRDAAERLGKRRGVLIVKLDSEGRASFERIAEDGEELTPQQHLLSYTWRGRRVDVGAPSFFFEEGSARKYDRARFGELRVAADGGSVLVGLRDEQLEPLGRGTLDEGAEE